MLEWSVAALQALDAVRRIVVALPPDELDAAPRRGRRSRGRRDEVGSRSARRCAACGDGDPVIVHDAARPLATADLFERALLELAGSGADAVIAATPVSDTIKEVGDDGRTVARTLDRAPPVGGADAAGVPARGARASAARRRLDELLAAATDDAWLVERAGGDRAGRRVGSGEPEGDDAATDLHVAELLLAERARA